MSSSDELRRKLADVASKRAVVDANIGKAEKKKSDKEADAASKSSRAASTKSEPTRRSYERQAASSRKAALDEQKKIATLSKKRSDLSKQEAALAKDLHAATKRENTSASRQADKDRREREMQRREDATRRQQDQLRQEMAHAAVVSRVELAENAVARTIATLREPVAEPLRILYGTATPDGDLRVGQEIRRVKKAVQASVHRDRVRIEHASDITSDDLLDLLTTFRPHVIHFSGHADADNLVFDDGSIEGEPKVIPIEVFMRAVSATDEKPKLVVLNACDSSVNLRPLLAAVPVAIGMAAEVGDADAIVFATRFYRAVADGQSIEGALAIARADLELNALEDQDLPTLICADGVDAAEVRLVLDVSDEL
jgi:hypothetical protein